MPVQPSSVEAWLEAYGRAWESRDPDAFAKLFTADASYRWTPFEAPKRGRDEIAAAVDAAVQRQSDIRFQSTLLATVDRSALAHWTCSFDRIGTGARVHLDGIFLMEFAPDGLCEGFREWWHSDEANG